ncbi:hypothetical protein A2U01_0001895 [Trifolium medium]|uniref:Uncharacterized protein n=2 Tax=Trifolium TaxID=3898 RepID=A0A2K3MRB2_TRIPR|nr:hypothetical protein [Trifolium medium]PNX93335.1 hypothetical protein L195_g016486 [Trifolium pratense]
MCICVELKGSIYCIPLSIVWCTLIKENPSVLVNSDVDASTKVTSEFVDESLKGTVPGLMSCQSYGLLWYLQTIVQDQTDGVEIDVRINVATSSRASASSAKEAGYTQGGAQGQAADLIWNDLL